MPVSKLERLVTFGNDTVSKTDTPKKDLMTLLQLGLISLAVTRAKCQKDGNLDREQIIETIYPDCNQADLQEEAYSIILDDGIVSDQIQAHSVMKIMDHLNVEKSLSDSDVRIIGDMIGKEISNSVQVGYLRLIGSFLVGLISSGIIAWIAT